MKTDQVLEIARRYYEQNVSQADIASAIGVSRSTVSRVLKYARQMGYVRTVVAGPASGTAHLESWFRSRFKLDHVAIVPVESGSSEAIRAVAQVAANYLERAVPENAVLTVAGGRTLSSLSSQLRPARRPDITVVPAMGGWLGQSAISANEVAREMAIRWEAQAEVLFAPAFVSDDLARQALLREQSIRNTLQKARLATVAAIGIAAVDVQPNDVQRRYVSTNGRIADDDLGRLLESGAAGETCSQFFDINGHPIDWWNERRTLAVPLRDFKRMSVVVAVGAGVEKARAFLGACRGGLVTALIISEGMASEIERLDGVT
jgi:DNA-binding transcriptional regulator LsrR (DeoR family)